MGDDREQVRKLVRAMADGALARCAREGIAPEDFYRALLAEGPGRGGRGGPGGVADLFERAMRRAKAGAN